MQQDPQTWDAVAPTYAEDVTQWTTYANEALRILPVGAGDRILDIATGPGTLALLAAPRAARVEAVDFSPGMIEQLAARAAQSGLTNVGTGVMDAGALRFPDESFDAAFCLFAYFFFPDRARAFHEMRRVLRPDGRALIATWGPIERRPMMKLGFEAMAEALPHLPRPSKGDLQDPDECVREMSEAGFRDVRAEIVTASVHVESAERYVDLVVRSGAPFAAMRKKLGDEVWSGIQAKLVEAVRRRFPTSGGADLSAEAILTIGTR